MDLQPNSVKSDRLLRYRPPADSGLVVRYLDEALIVLEKPSGLLAVPGRGADKQDCLASRALKRYPEALVVHRLDMATSGLMLMARGTEAQRRLGRMFQQRRVEKRYLAVVGGVPNPGQGEIDLPLITDWPNRPKQKVDHRIGKPALTRYRVVATDLQANTARVQLFPHTGRSHQLRVHLLAIGHPILGDELYAGARWQQASERLLLHAEWLQFPHPFTGEPVSVTSNPDF